jgi:DNA-binding GntR family transcriptional regulator
MSVRTKSQAKTDGPASVNLRLKVYEAIKRQIITGQLAPGQPVSEAQFAEQFKVSKTPIREALTSLQQDHLVEYIPNRGFMVASISYQDVQEIFEARLFYEVALFKLALRHITREEIELLESYSKVVYELDDPAAVEGYQQANLDFHLSIARLARNNRLYWHYTDLLNEAQRLIYVDFKRSNVLPAWQHSHEDILAALRDGDEIAGAQAIEQTLEKAKKRILGM